MSRTSAGGASYWEEHYGSLLSGGALATMVCAPSFDGKTAQYGVSLVRTEEAAPESDDPHTVTWSLVVRVGEPRRRGKDSKRVKELSLPLHTEDARAIAVAWRAVVRRTRYPRPRYSEFEDGTRYEIVWPTVDGTTHRFHCGRFEGETQNPSGFSAGLVRLAQALRAAAEAPLEEQALALQSCVEHAERIRAEVEAAPW